MIIITQVQIFSKVPLGFGVGGLVMMSLQLSRKLGSSSFSSQSAVQSAVDGGLSVKIAYNCILTNFHVYPVTVFTVFLKKKANIQKAKC